MILSIIIPKAPSTDEQVFLDKFYLLVCTWKNWQLLLDKEPGLKASRTSFSTIRKLACVYVQQGTLGQEIFVYVLNSCGLVKVAKKKYCQISRTHEQINPVKENLLVCTGLQWFPWNDSPMLCYLSYACFVTESSSFNFNIVTSNVKFTFKIMFKIYNDDHIDIEGLHWITKYHIQNRPYHLLFSGLSTGLAFQRL